MICRGGERTFIGFGPSQIKKIVSSQLGGSVKGLAPELKTVKGKRIGNPWFLRIIDVCSSPCPIVASS